MCLFILLCLRCNPTAVNCCLAGGCSLVTMMMSYVSWPINCSVSLQILNNLYDSNHIFNIGRASGVRRTHGRHFPPGINMDNCYITNNVMYARILNINITFNKD